MSDTLNLANSIWPNGMKVDSDGHAVFYPLGTNKLNVPMSCTQWPKGNKLISPFVFQDDKLVGFVDTKALKVPGDTTIYLTYEHIEAEFSAINKGRLQIHAPKATTKKASWKDSGVEDIPEAQFKYKGCKTVADVETIDNNYLAANLVDGVWSEALLDLEQGGGENGISGMFRSSSHLTSFTADLPSLTHAYGMFNGCSLVSFASDLSSLTSGSAMFNGCENLTSFSSNLSSLTDGGSMFGRCENLTSFSTDLPSLTNGYGMFNECYNLTSFSSNLSNLENGRYMFDYCENLTSFSSNLSSLTDGVDMFSSCKLDAPSVKNIIDTINTYSGASFTLGMGCNDTTEDKDIFAQEVGYADMASLLAALQAKGWTVTAQYNGRPTLTLN